MGDIYKNYRLLVASLAFFLVVFSINSQEVSRDSIAMIKEYQLTSRNALSVNDFEKAFISINQANNLATILNNDELKADIYLDLAELHYTIHNYEKAESETINAIAFLKDINNKSSLAKAHTLFGKILIEKGNLKDAEGHLKNADKIYSELNDEIGRANSIFSYGLLELKKGKPKEAINYFEASLSLFKTHKLTRQECLTYLKESEAILNLDEPILQNSLNAAKLTLANALNIIDRENYQDLMIEFHRIDSKIAVEEDDIQRAIIQLQLYTHKKDSINDVYLKAISSAADAESDIGNLNEIIANQQDDLNEKQKSINFGKMTTGLSIALIIILSLLALSLFKNNNLRAKANDLLKDKNIELTLSKERAEKASLAKAQFLSTITHELRTPLYAVTGLTHLLLEENPKPEQKDHLNSLKFSGEYLLSLINNILDLNKLEANKVEIEKTTFNLKKRINDVLIALRKTADDKRNELHFEYDESIPEKLIGDPLKLSQVLINLIGNSVKFTQNGDVFVRVKKIEETNEKVNLHIEIEDNGVGISSKKQKSIFETFSQGSLQINRKFGGSGLGLSIVKNLLELMNSKIQLESQLGKGSKFWFDISFEISEESQEEENTKKVVYDVDYAALENVSILVVEDNKINQMITKKILEKYKMVCKVADNGMDAIKMVKENNFEVILMDIHMPGISGIEATQKIREFDKDIPILALTAVTIDENLDDFYKAGFNEIIPKPFKPEEFFEKIYRSLEGNKFSVDH
jgi:signal transduction histidine kinase/ActR/RegA family two-component response regulator